MRNSGRKSNPLVTMIRAAWMNADGKRRAILTYVPMSVLAVGLGLLEPIIISNLLKILQHERGEALLQGVQLSILLYFGLSLAVWTIHGTSRIIELNVGFHIKRNLRLRLVEHVISLPTHWHRSHHSGDTIERISKATTALEQFSQSSFQIIQLTTRFLGSLILLCIFLPSAGIIIVCLLILSIAIVVTLEKKLKEYYGQLNSNYRWIASGIQDFLGKVTTVKSLRLQDKVSQELALRITAGQPLAQRVYLLAMGKWFTTNILVALTIALVLALFCFLSLRRSDIVEVGSVFLLYDYLRKVGDGFLGFAGVYSTIVQFAADIEQAEQLLSEESCTLKERRELPSDWDTLSLKGIQYSHTIFSPDAHLADISLRLKRGTSIALVGHSGAGKSTLLGSLRGLHSASIQDIRREPGDIEVMPEDVFGHTSLIPQEPEIFSGTIRFNITLGIEASDMEVLKAVELACFSSVLERLPEGLDTDISENGVNLSGGEKQRLALARGFFFARESQILLLDEPTSSIDPMNEQIIYVNLLNEFRDQCIVSTIHKFYLLPMFDHIIVLGKGKVLEEGSFHELLSQKGEFFHLWEHYKSIEQEVEELSQLARQ